jgi:hypothetical protein
MFMTIIEMLTKCLFIAAVVVIAKIGVDGMLMTIIEVLTECLLLLSLLLRSVLTECL